MKWEGGRCVGPKKFKTHIEEKLKTKDKKLERRRQGEREAVGMRVREVSDG